MYGIVKKGQIATVCGGEVQSGRYLSIRFLWSQGPNTLLLLFTPLLLRDRLTRP